MPVYRLGPDLIFPPPDAADPDGLLAVGGDLTPERLLLAYSMGIFPWYDEDLPILWHSPDPRMLLLAEDLHVPQSLRKVMKRKPFELTLSGEWAYYVVYPENRVGEANIETFRNWIVAEARREPEL